MRRVIARPATVVVASDGDSDDYFLCLEAWASDEHDSALSVELHGSYDYRIIDVDRASIVVDRPGLLSGVTSGGRPITVRDVESTDSIGLPGMPSYSLPPTVIGATLAGENMDTHIEALTEDDGYVATLLLVTDVGMWVRYGGSWTRLTSLELIDGMNSVDVDESAVDLYDAADRADTQLPVDRLPGRRSNVADRPAEVHVAANAARTFTSPVTAAMATIPFVIETVRDVPRAIEAAVADESLRWYVERRARALDPETRFPWRESSVESGDETVES